MNIPPQSILQLLEECQHSIDARGELPSIERKKIYEKIKELSARENGNTDYN